MTIQYDILTDTDEQYLMQTRHVKLFNRDVMRDLLDDLTVFYGERPGRRHRDALLNIVYAATALADRRDYKDDELALLPADATRRPCFDLACGMAKSRALVSWCAVNARSNFPYSILILAEKLDELESIYHQLTGSGDGQKGIDPAMVGVWHSDDKRAHRLPQHTPEECKVRPILLLSHSKASTNPEWANEYEGGDRDLIWYDESLVAMLSVNYTLKTLMDLIANVANAVQYGKRIEHGALVERVLRTVKVTIDDEWARQCAEREAGEDVTARPLIPDLGNLDHTELRQLNDAFDTLCVEEEDAKTLLHLVYSAVGQRAMRVWNSTTRNDDAVITFDLKVPEEYRRVVVTDAKYRMREVLREKASTLELPYGEEPGEPLKTYRNLTIHLASIGSGKGAVATEYGRRKLGGDKLAKMPPAGPLTKFVLHAVQQTPADEAAIVWVFKPFEEVRKSRARYAVDQKEVLEHHLRAAGVDLDETIEINGEPEPRIVVRTWGRHTAESRLSYTRHAIFGALLYQRDSTLVGLVSALSGDHLLSPTPSRIQQLRISEAGSDLDQALNRSAMRGVNARGEAFATTVWLPIHDQMEGVLTLLLKEALPGCDDIRPWTNGGELKEPRLTMKLRLRWHLLSQAETHEAGSTLSKGRLRNGKPGLWALAELEKKTTRKVRGPILAELLEEDEEIRAVWTETPGQQVLLRR